jgi:hypothetical protein
MDAFENDIFDWSLYRPEEIPNLHVYQYHHLDDLSFVRKPEDVFSDTLSPTDFNRLMEAVKERFLKAGWEGDGSFGIIWLPPFLDAGNEDTWGNYLWHVKQENNGTSWVGSKEPLHFPRIKSQNSAIPEDAVLISLVFHSAKEFVTNIVKLLTSTKTRIEGLKDVPTALASDIQNELLIAAQGELIGNVQSFFDDCYLEVLVHVVDGGNRSRIQLRKFKTSLNPAGYIPDAERAYSRDEEANEVGRWFTLKGIVGDIWRSYRFEPFRTKLELLFNACDFKIDSDISRLLIKHVLLRNCIQHHGRFVTQEALKEAGVKEFSVVNSKQESIRFGGGDLITFPLEELNVFVNSMARLAEAFDRHMASRVPPTWVSKSVVQGTTKPGAKPANTT